MKRILVVDDDVGVQKAVQLVLAMGGYEVQLASDGPEAIKMLDEFRPDLILADYAMPKMSGVELCQAIKQNPRDRIIPFVLLTGNQDIEVMLESLQVGATDFITKPFKREELLARVGAHIAHYEIILDTVQADFKQMRDNLLSTVSHEMRTPLSIIMGHAGILVDDLESAPDVLKLCLGSVYKASLQLNQVVEDMIFLSQAQSGRLGFFPKEFAIEVLLTQLVQQYDEDPGQITLDLPPTNLPTITADYNKIKLAMKHLIDNAIKFKSQGQSAIVKITVEADQTHMKISVIDKGIGLSEALLTRVFEPLFQLDGTAERSYEGLGAGLKIVQYVARLHNGKIDVESREGHGSTFTLTLPLLTPS